MPRVAIYARVSTDEQAKEGYSLDAQKDRLEAFCEAQGWDIVQHYIDEGYSGRNIKRPQYRRMIDEKDQWDMILVMKMDRIHRNSKNFMTMMENLEKWGKRFTSMSESLDTSNAVGRFVMDIIQRIAQLESEQIGERTHMGMRQKAELGNGILGFNVPFGYRLREGRLSIIEEEALTVRTIFNEYSKGQTMAFIAWKLNQGSLQTRRQNHWTVFSIRRILHNPIYAGFMKWEDLLVPNDHEQIISIHEFNVVQSAISSKVRNKAHRHYLQLPEVAGIVHTEEELTISY